MMYLKKNGVFIILIISITLFPTKMNAQMENNNNNNTDILFWLNSGVGMNQLGYNNLGYSAGGNMCCQIGKCLLCVSGTFNLEFIFNTSPTELVWDIGPLIGIIEKDKIFYISASTGVSLIGGVKRGQFKYSENIGGWVMNTKDYYEINTFINVGIPIEFQVFWTPLSFIGVGICGHININSEKTFSVILLCIQIGKL
jgi:hypothetical protein